MSKFSDSNLIWIDLEMTGLRVEEDKIIEIATVVTDEQLTILAEGPALAIHQNTSTLAGMDEWNTKHHHASGLVERVKASALNEAAAEKQTLAFLQDYVGPRKSPMCGNTICQDRRFLARYMPDLERYFHYRHIDVSTIKELAKRWQPKLYHQNKKVSQHVALADIIESIEELKYYREHFIHA